MKCPNCGAEATGNFCEYCGSEMPKDSTNNNLIGNNITINNFYNTTDNKEKCLIQDSTNETKSESSTGIVSLILSILAFLVSFFSVGFGIIIFVPAIICASIALLNHGCKTTCAKITFAIFLLFIFTNF